MDEKAWSRKLIKSHKVLAHMETMKHLEPFYSEAYKELVAYSIATQFGHG